MKKFCKKCKIEQPIYNFHKHNKKPDGLQIYCKSCKQTINKKYQKQNGYQKKILNNNNRKKYKEEISIYKAKFGCVVCNEKDPCCLDFHHLDPALKHDNIATLINNMKITEVREEIKKCIVICANCHRKLHAGKLEAVADKVMHLALN